MNADETCSRVEEPGEVRERLVALGRHEHRGALGGRLEAAQVGAGQRSEEPARLFERRFGRAVSVDHSDERLERIEIVRLAAFGLEVPEATHQRAGRAVGQPRPECGSQRGGLLGRRVVERERPDVVGEHRLAAIGETEQEGVEVRRGAAGGRTLRGVRAVGRGDVAHGELARRRWRPARRCRSSAKNVSASMPSAIGRSGSTSRIASRIRRVHSSRSSAEVNRAQNASLASCQPNTPGSPSERRGDLCDQRHLALQQVAVGARVAPLRPAQVDELGVAVVGEQAHDRPDVTLTRREATRSARRPSARSSYCPTCGSICFHETNTRASEKPASLIAERSSA